MRLLLDSHILLGIAGKAPQLPFHLQNLINDSNSSIHVSTATLWELAIKSRLRKLDPGFDLMDAPALLAEAGYILLDIGHTHVFADIRLEPNTRDPFDRLLLGVCAAEDLKFVTLDRALADHPLAWRPIPPRQ